MGLKIETWNVAYRKRSRGILDISHPFLVIQNGMKGWYADPFLFDYEEDTYLFAEFFSYKLNRGVIAYSKYDKRKEKFGKYKEIIIEDFHLSYPVVFEFKGKIYMMPETSEAEALFLYEAVAFPDEWKRVSVVMDGVRLLDTTPITCENRLYALTMCQNENDYTQGDLLLLEYNGSRFCVSGHGVLNSDMSVLRPGGHFIMQDNKLYRVSQDCEGSYGKAINIMEMSETFPEEFAETLKRKIYPKDVTIDIKEEPAGMHTYNVSKELEVIDLKFYRKSFYRVLCKLLSFVK